MTTVTVSKALNLTHHLCGNKALATELAQLLLLTVGELPDGEPLFGVTTRIIVDGEEGTYSYLDRNGLHDWYRLDDGPQKAGDIIVLPAAWRPSDDSPLIVGAANKGLKKSERESVWLATYADHLDGVDEQAFWGVTEEAGGKVAWTVAERNSVLRHLQDAETMMQGELGFGLLPKWVTGETVREIGRPTQLKQNHLLAIGGRISVELSDAWEIDYQEISGVQTAVIGPMPAGSASSAMEIEVCHPNTFISILPSKIALEAGQVLIHIPRYRLVKTDKQNTNEYGVFLDDDALFEKYVTVRWIHPNPLYGVEVVYPQYGTFWTRTVEAKVEILNALTSEVIIRPKESVVRPASAPAPYAMISYLAGGARLEDERALIKACVDLAHANMPSSPVKRHCGRVEDQWDEARKLKEGATSGFGNEAGARSAYAACRKRKIWRFG